SVGFATSRWWRRIFNKDDDDDEDCGDDGDSDGDGDGERRGKGQHDGKTRVSSSDRFGRPPSTTPSYSDSLWHVSGHPSYGDLSRAATEVTYSLRGYTDGDAEKQQQQQQQGEGGGWQRGDVAERNGGGRRSEGGVMDGEGAPAEVDPATTIWNGSAYPADSAAGAAATQQQQRQRFGHRGGVVAGATAVRPLIDPRQAPVPVVEYSRSSEHR
ncbi:unnamed protein product, partial [Pylaiella littoralis]